MEFEYVEEIRSSSSNTTKSFPAGLRVLLVDDDPICLKIVSTMLRLSLYEVVSVDEGSNALKLLRERQGGFDLVVTDVHMPIMDGFVLLEHIVREFKIPVIMMSADDKLKVVTRGLESGACFYLLKPLTLNDVQNLWQHVVRRKKEQSVFDQTSPTVIHHDHASSLPHDQIAIMKEDCASSFDVGASSREREHDNKRKAKEIARSNSNQEQDHEDNEGRERSGAHKKARVVWTPNLHDSFLEAIDRLGIDKAVPKKILELMNVPGLTRENVASHLQKYRIFIKRLKEASRTMDPRNPRCLSNLLGPGFPLARPTLLNLQQGFPHYYQEQQRQWLQLQQAANHSSTARSTTSTRPALMPPPPSSSSSSSYLLDHQGGASSSSNSAITRARTNNNNIIITAHHQQQWPGNNSSSSINISSTNIAPTQQAIAAPRPLYNAASNATAAGGSITNLSVFQAPQLSSFSAGSSGNNIRRSPSSSSSSFGRFNNNNQAPDLMNPNNNGLFSGTQQMGNNINGGGGDGGVSYNYKRMEEALNKVNMLSFGGESTSTGTGITGSNINNIGSGTSSSSGYGNTGLMIAPNNVNAGYGNNGLLATGPNNVNAGYGNNGLMGTAANNVNEFTGAPPLTFPNLGAQQQERAVAEAQKKESDGVGGEIDSWLQLLGGTTTSGTESDFDSLLYPTGNQIIDPDFNIDEYQMEGNNPGF